MNSDLASGKLMVLAIAGFAIVASPSVAAGRPVETEHQVHPQTGIESWRFRRDGVEVLLMQISPDQARAFFLGRGFLRADVDHYASSCVFMTLVTNRSARSISYRLADWSYRQGGGAVRTPKLKDEWLREWEMRGVEKSSRIAFEWSQHPAEQVLEPGDSNQGMTTFLVPHGEQFDLSVKWKRADRVDVGSIKGVLCAK